MAPIKRSAPEGGKDLLAKPTNSDHPAKKFKKSESTSYKGKSKDDIEKKASAPKTPHASKLSSLREEEISFPRGGASILTPLEHKQIQIDATRDALFETSVPKGIKAKRVTEDYDSGDEMNENEPEVAGKKRKRTKKTKKTTGEVEKAEDAVRIEGLSYKVCIFATVNL
jgi:rRNA biogenesis protein RRP5